MDIKGEGTPYIKNLGDEIEVSVEEARQEPLLLISAKSLNKEKSLSIDYCFNLISRMQGQYALMAEIMLCCGMRPIECVNLRVRHIDFESNKIKVPGRTGCISRTVFIPPQLRVCLKEHQDTLYESHQHSVAEGFGYVSLPIMFRGASESDEFSWQWMFSAAGLMLEDKEDHLGESRVDIILDSFSERLRRSVYGVSEDLRMLITPDIFWRSYLAGV